MPTAIRSSPTHKRPQGRLSGRKKKLFHAKLAKEEKREGREGTAAFIRRSGTPHAAQIKMRLRRKGDASEPVRPELVEGLPFFFEEGKMQGCDRLSPSVEVVSAPSRPSFCFASWPKARFILSACKAAEGREICSG
jgi:hypothetical protein